MKTIRPHLLVLGVLLIVALTGMHQAFHHALADKRLSWFPREASGEIVIVAIDSPSIAKIGVWPWPRRLHAELIEQLDRAQVSDIVFDVDFSSPSDANSDQAFAAALKSAGGSVVLPSFKQVVETRGKAPVLYVNRPLPLFAEQTWSALVNVVTEPDGLVRRYPFGEMLDGHVLPSVASMLAGKLEKNTGSFAIDFSIRSDTIPGVSYVDVLRGDAATLRSLKGKKVIVGATAIELGDRFNVPNGQVIPGPVLQVLAAETITQNRMLMASSSAVTFTGILAIGLLMLLLWRRVSAARRVIVVLGLAVVIEAAAHVLQGKFAVMLDTSLFHTAIAAYLAAMALDEIDFRSLIGAIAEKRFQRIAMSLGDGVVCTDRDGKIMIWNSGAAALFGYDADEIIGHPFNQLCFATNESPRPFRIDHLPQELLQTAGGHVIEVDGLRRNGGRFPLEACFSGWQGADGFQYGAVLRDISERKREAERIRFLAEYDTLTGLANRHTLHEHLDRELARARAEGLQVALMLMDLDKFKEVNDTLGHGAGDEVLRTVADQLKSLLSGDELAARLSGDEFALVICGSNVAERAATLAKASPSEKAPLALTVSGRSLHVRASIGIAIYPDNSSSVAELISDADLALYRAKADGRGQHAFFDRAIRESVNGRRAIEAELAVAVEKQEFELFYQPQVDLRTRKLLGAEALIRWRHPQRGLVSPAEFMPIVNQSPLSNVVASWVLRTACRQGRLWEQGGYRLRIGVNLSPSQFQSDGLDQIVASVLRETAFSPSLLELEVTEDILLEDDARALSIFRRIQALGVLLAFDDFGTGYASLSYLKKFQLDVLKIDQSFVRGISPGSDDAAIVGASIFLGKQLGLTVIAEGVEDQDAVDLLLAMGCEQGQGYYFGRPMPVNEFESIFFTGNAIAAA